MQEDKRFKKLRVIIVTLFIFSCIPITLLYLFIRDISSISSFLNNYIGTGNSLFIPILPNYNLLWYLPEPFNVIQFSLGHLIDIFILINIIGYIQTSIYHYFIKRLYFDENIPSFYLNLITLKTGQAYLLIPDPEDQFNDEKKLKNLKTSHDFEIDIKNFDNLNKKLQSKKSIKFFKYKTYNHKFSLKYYKLAKLIENHLNILFLKILRIFNLAISNFVKNYKKLILINIFKGRGV